MRRRELMVSKARLPDAYQEVEWIYGNAAPYIILPNLEDDEFEIWAEVIPDDYSSSSTEICISGNVYNVGSAGYLIGFYNNKFEAYTSLRQTNLMPACPFVSGEKYDIYAKFTTAGKTVKLDGTSYAQTVSATYANADMHMLFGRGTVYGTSNRFSGKMLYYKFESEHLNVEMIPCYRKSDGEIGMYDLVTKTFFTNQGSGSFTKGADV